MKTSLQTTMKPRCVTWLSRQASSFFALVLMAFATTPSVAQNTNVPVQAGTNQAAPKPDLHFETQPTYDMDLTGGRAKPKPPAKPTRKPNLPAKPSSNQNETPAEKTTGSPLTPYELFRKQADALQFPPEQQGTAHPGIRTYVRYTYILTNLEHQASNGKPLSLEEQASLAFDFFLREIKTGEFKGATPQENAGLLLEISERPPATSPPPEEKLAPVRLSDPQIAAVAYLALRYVEYLSPPDLERGYKPGIINLLTHSVYWNPRSELLHTGLTRTSLPKTLIDIPLAKTDPPCIEPPAPRWLPPQALTNVLKGINQGGTLGLVLIYYNDIDDSPFERRMFRTNIFTKYLQENRVAVIKAICGKRQNSDSPEFKLQQQYGVTAFPMMIVLGAEGQELARPSVTESGPEPLLIALDGCKKVNAATAAKAREEYLQSLHKPRPPRRTGKPFQ